MKYCLILLFFITNGLSGFTQSKDAEKKMDSILNVLHSIMTELRTKNAAEVNLNKSTEQNKKDLEKINDLNEQIVDLKKERDQAIKSKNESEAKIKSADSKTAELKNDHKEFLEKEIDIVIKSPSTISTDLLLLLKKQSEESLPANKSQLQNFIDIADSIKSIKKVFDEEYQTERVQQYKQRLNQLSKMKDKYSKMPELSSEINKMRENLDNYCEKTNEVFAFFKKVYVLRKDFSKNDVFRLELEKMLYKTRSYPFLTKLVDRYYQESDVQDRYSNKEPFNCK